MTDRTDETWHRLLVWTYGQPASERLAAHVLVDAGYEDIDPSHPLGGPDGQKDAVCSKDGESWIMAVYFPRDRQPFSAVKKKFLEDHAGVAANAAFGMAFVTNQELSLAEREQLRNAAETPVDIFHLERVAHALDKPAMHRVREQYLRIPSGPPTAAAPPRTAREILDAAVPPPGAGRRNSVYEGMLALRVVVVPVPGDLRHPDAANPRAALAAASAAATETTARWPPDVSLLARRLSEGWEPMAAHNWGAGYGSENAETLARHDFAAASFTTQRSVVCIDRTWATTITDDNGNLAYHAAREPEVAGELLVALRLAASLLEDVPAVDEVDVVVQIAAAPAGLLVASERAGGRRFHKPTGYITPTPEVPSHYLDSGRFRLEQLRDPYQAAEQLLGAWLSMFRTDPLFDRLRADE